MRFPDCGVFLRASFGPSWPPSASLCSAAVLPGTGAPALRMHAPSHLQKVGSISRQQSFCSYWPFRAQLLRLLPQEAIPPAIPDPMAGPQQSPRRPPLKHWPHRVMLTYTPNSPAGLGAPRAGASVSDSRLASCGGTEHVC